jgi:hypothetical protein
MNPAKLVEGNHVGGMDAYEFTYALYSCIYNAMEQKQAKYRAPQSWPCRKLRKLIFLEPLKMPTSVLSMQSVLH